MKIYTTLQIGEYHINHCEDYLFVEKVSNNKIICAVMDGCTMGNDSYLASTLTGKLLRKIVKTRNYREFFEPNLKTISLEILFKTIIQELFTELKVIKNQLMLEREELLTTLIFLVVDEIDNKGIVMVIGDGLVSINGTITEFDQDNRLDYIGYHLTEDFETWYNGQRQKLFFDKVKDISITTDGIGTFTKINAITSNEKIDPVQFLIKDETDLENSDMLNLKMKKLEHVFGLKPSDDLTIVRLIRR